MRRRCLFFLVAALGITSASLASDFITARAGKLFEGTNEFRFLSFNIPNLLMIEDNIGFHETNPWRLPIEFEIQDALETVRALGGTVARTYVITVRRTNDTPAMPRHVNAPGQFDEAAFRVLDTVLAEANRSGIRLIIPLVDEWSWMGGRAEYARWRGKHADAFWTDPQLKEDFKATIRYVLTRTNTVSRVRYADDPAVLCWETGNELNSPPTWTGEMARFIKMLAPRQLVMDGFHTAVLRESSLAEPNVDIVTSHHYPGGQGSFADAINANADRARGRKAYVVGEFGFVSTAEMMAAMQAIKTSGASGGLLWSLRFRNRDGGFYWHSEPSGGNLYKAFHWPPSPLGDAYDESTLMGAVRSNAFSIRGLELPSATPPAAPRLLPISDVAAISWQGSVGATHYVVERASSPVGPWRPVASDVNEAFTQYRPQFSDETATRGEWFYRVRAANEAGASPPSNTQKALVTIVTMVDEFADFARTHSREGHWQIAVRDCRSAKEDAHRAIGQRGDVLVYRANRDLLRFQLIAFWPKESGAVEFEASPDGEQWRGIPAHQETSFQGAGEYGYWPAALFNGDLPAGTKLFRIRLTRETQLSRLELVSAARIP